jgi:hypothetical protein
VTQDIAEIRTAAYELRAIEPWSKPSGQAGPHWHNDEVVTVGVRLDG